MIFYLCHRLHANTLASLLIYFRRDLQDFVRIVPYEERNHLLAISSATVIWTDLDRLSQSEIQSSAELSEQLRIGQPDIVQLNHPAKTLQRFDLLRLLYADGSNRFNVYRPEKLPDELRFPVFLRDEAGATYKTPRLLNTPEQLRVEIANLGAARFVRPMVVEFESKPLRDGYYRKYAAYRAGDHSYAQHCFASRDWFIKDPGKGMAGAHLAEHAAYVRDNPHAAELMPIFEKAAISYGRIDYTIVDARIQVFEINTNPTVLNYPPTIFDSYDSLPYANMHADALMRLPHAQDRVSHPDIDRAHLHLLGRLRTKYRRRRVKLTVRKGFSLFKDTVLGAKASTDTGNQSR
ncbi:hypothetical protein [Mesorhizobium erdmanii]|uniref:hypothetical protein n=1 Tax=Mesorhizobium erdmanii TaxID=1777866 RepID=UPI000AA4757D|nr:MULTISPECIES: hypothetical protein [Mesorhizobium]